MKLLTEWEKRIHYSYSSHLALCFFVFFDDSRRILCPCWHYRVIIMNLLHDFLLFENFTERERERLFFPLLVSSPNDHNRQIRANWSPEPESASTYPRWQRPKYLVNFPLTSACTNRKLNWKQSSQGSNQHSDIKQMGWNIGKDPKKDVT